MTQALAGYRIVDFTQVFAGPFATQQLGQLGAEVIKVEQPGVGDTTRAGITDPTQGKIPAAFFACNIGKKSITVDLKHPEGLRLIESLLLTADALVENFRPGVMARLGLDYERVKALKPDIVYCSVSGYGQTGDKSKLPAFDGAIQAASGMMSITGTPESGPLRTGYYGVDMATAMNAAFSIAASLLRRERTGEGQHLDVAMMDTALTLIGPQMAMYLANGTKPKLQGNRSPTGQPTANVFATSDGHLQVVGLKDNHAARLLSALDLEPLANEFPAARDRIKNFDVISEAVAKALMQNTCAHWLDTLIEAGVPVSEVRTIEQVAADPQNDGRRALTEVPLGNHTSDTVRTVTGGHVANVDAPQVPRSAPTLGEHTQEVLRELGYSDQEQARLAEQKTILKARP